MKTQQELEEKLAEIESDTRLGYSLATIRENSPLALIQLDLKSKAGMLRWALGLPGRRYHGRDEEK